MSDFRPAPSGEDRVRDTLTALRSDAERVPLSDSSAVRRRGQARSRHQAITGVAAAFVLVAAVVAGGTLVSGNNDAADNVPATQGPSPDDGKATSARTAASFLLSADEMPNPEFWGQFGTWAQVDAGDDPTRPLSNSCFGAAVPDTLRMTATGIVEFRAGPADGPHAGLQQWVYPLGDLSPATASGRVQSQLQSCADSHSDDVLHESTFADIGGGRLFERSFSGTENARGLDSVAWGTADGYLVVLALESPGIQDVPPTGGMEQALSAALSGDDPATQETARTLAPDPFLTSEDVGEIGPYTSFQRSPDEGSADQQSLQCISRPTSWGATEAKGQFFYSDLDATFVEHVLRFTNATSAAAALSDVSAQFSSCAQPKPADATAVDVGPTMSGGIAGVDETLHAARTTTPKAASEISYYELAVSRVGNVLVVLQWSSMGNPFDSSTQLVWSDQLVKAAAERAVG